MKNSSKIVMVATIIMVVGVALVLGLVLILLAELCCSLFLRRRHFRKNPPTSTPRQINGAADGAPSSLGSFYSQGVLQAPRSMLFPPNSNVVDFEKQNSQEILQAQVPSDAQVSSQKLQQEEQFMYISNPIYSSNSKVDTPFVTPDTSPSRLEKGIDSCGEDDDEGINETPPLTPMKKLPAEGEGCSVSLRDVRSLCTTGSDSNSNNECISTSSLGSPSTSPSW